MAKITDWEGQEGRFGAPRTLTFWVQEWGIGGAIPPYVVARARLKRASGRSLPSRAGREGRNSNILGGASTDRGVETRSDFTLFISQLSAARTADATGAAVQA